MIVRPWAPEFEVPDEVPAAALGPLEVIHQQARMGQECTTQQEVDLLLSVFTPRQYRAIRWHGEHGMQHVIRQLIHGWGEAHRGAPGPWIEEPISCR
ncbi:hypothetical protein SAMN05660199_00175 [Klenkia soli]|uniref:Uncharacterized protein n=1 Tax=Klenkia soli TaxID=1052260 RepID=A0A1H0C177_9ACTN|nr:hypothetical protein [Klenkia soli]SDN51570.1 hypothetical protein SAMN05660199_00175 [Klenkia soli]